jgi:hypothetical protein
MVDAPENPDANTGDLPRPVLAFLTRYESELRVPNGFVVRLLAESNDWSFVLKLHGLLEGAVSKKLLELLGRPALAKPLGKVQMRTLIAFAHSLDAISSRSVTFLEGLGELRNRLVHDIVNVGFELDRWATDSAGASVRGKLLGPDGEKGLALAAPFNPYRFVLWGQALAVMAELQAATVAHAQGFLALIEAEVERRGKLEAEATREALLRLMADSAESPDATGNP